MKFSFHRDSQDERTLYEQRIAELEAELDAAQQVIEGQQQVLEANLEASCREEAEVVTLNLPAEPLLPPLRATSEPSAIERPPIPLPDFGPPLTDIAQRVFRAADSGAASGQDAEPLPVMTLQPSPSDQETEEESFAVPAPAVWSGDRFRSLKISAALLASVLILALFWSFASHTAPPRAKTNTLPMTMAAIEHVQPTALPSRPAPAIEKTEIKRPAAAYRRVEPKKSPAPRPIQSVLQTAKASPTLSDPEEKWVYHKKETARFHSRRPRRIASGSSREQEPDRDDDFAREERRHPPPGWDEEADRWLDRQP